MTIYNRSNPPFGSYIYAYIRSKDSKTAKAGTPYYIGKGTGVRAWHKNLKDRVPSPSSDDYIVILEANLTDLGGYALERFYIRWYGRKDNNTGILINATDGGEGLCGYEQTKEHRKKISEARKKNWSTNDELRKKISEKGKGNQNGRFHAGWIPTEETKQRMSEAKKDRPQRRCSCVICHKEISVSNVVSHYKWRHKKGGE